MEPSRATDRFDRFARLSEDIQRRIIEIDNKPERRKNLRRCSTREAAGLIGISDAHLRRVLIEDPSLPQGEQAGNRRRKLALEEINAIRDRLLERTGDPRYRAFRDGAAPVLSFANFKGGAAKTTTAVHFAQHLARLGRRVLLIDLDSQASATGLFGFNPDEDFEDVETLYGHLSGEADLPALIRPTYWPRLDLVPANLGLYRAEFELPARQAREPGFEFWSLLRRGLEPLREDYDAVICDTPPSLGYLTINALCAATGLIVPAPPSMLDFASTGRFFRMMADTLEVLERYEGREAARLAFARVLITKFNPADRNHVRVASWMAANYGDQLLTHRMAMTTALDMAGSAKRTLYEADISGARRTFERGYEHLQAVNAEVTALLDATAPAVAAGAPTRIVA